jgi:hypothetical protein
LKEKVDRFNVGGVITIIPTAQAQPLFRENTATSVFDANIVAEGIPRH